MTPDNLTRAEASERSALVFDVAYDVALDLTTGPDTFGCEARVTFGSANPGAATFIDIDAAQVFQAELNGRPIHADLQGSRLRLEGLQARNELRVRAAFAYQRTGVGMHRFTDPVDGNVYLHTQFEPFDAHRVYPCFDQPDLKGTFQLSVRAPADWRVISCGRQVADEDGWRRFETTPPVSTYITAVVAGPYVSVESRHGEIPLGIWCRRSLLEHVDHDEIFDITRQGLDFFAEEFDYAYPFTKYDQLFVPEFNFGAMENAGCVTFNESYVFRSRVTDSAREGRASTILHEMAHMWFGDLVTMRWWDDLWLNESFATYMATDALVRATRFTDAWVRFAFGTKAAAYAADQMPSTHPISADIVDTDAVRLHFDRITYNKGASVLKQLVAWVGEDAFRSGNREYFRRNEWKNAELADFLSTLEASSGRDLSAWSAEWLQTAGVNTLRPGVEVADGVFRSAEILQEPQLGHPALRSHRLGVGLYDDSSDGVVRRSYIELDIVGERTAASELVGQSQPDLLLLNDADLAYAKARLDERSLQTILTRLSAIVDPLARTIAWASVWDMVRDAELAARRFVDLVCTHAPAEPDDAMLQRILAQASVAIDAYGDPSNREVCRRLVAAAARSALESAAPGSDRQLVWARTFASHAQSSDEIKYLTGVLDGSVTVDGLSVDTDLRWHILSSLAEIGGVDEAAIDAELRSDPTDIGRRRAESARAARPVQEAKQRAWDQLTAGTDTPLATMRAIGAGFGRWGQDEILEPYVQRYFESMPAFWQDRTREEAQMLSGSLYPSTLVRAEVAETTREALRTAPNAQASRILAEHLDNLERAMRARERDIEEG